MAEFLTTKAIAAHLESIIKKAEKELYILTPYLKLSSSFHERLSEAMNGNIHSCIVYGKNVLDKREQKLLNELPTNVFFKENLHGKCYANEKVALITSLNLHSFSEANNREFGVLLTKQDDEEAFEDCLIEIKSIIKSAVQERLKHTSASIEKIKKPILSEVAPVEESFIHGAWENYLVQRFPFTRFKRDEQGYITAENFPVTGMSFSTRYGFISISLPGYRESLKVLKEREYDDLIRALQGYRVYWSPADSLRVYFGKDCKFEGEGQEISYCSKALEIIISTMQRFSNILLKNSH
jgi:hypothetical protein